MGKKRGDKSSSSSQWRLATPFRSVAPGRRKRRKTSQRRWRCNRRWRWRHKVMPDNCTCLFGRRYAPGTPSRSGCRCISAKWNKTTTTQRSFRVLLFRWAFQCRFMIVQVFALVRCRDDAFYRWFVESTRQHEMLSFPTCYWFESKSSTSYVSQFGAPLFVYALNMPISRFSQNHGHNKTILASGFFLNDWPKIHQLMELRDCQRAATHLDNVNARLETRRQLVENFGQQLLVFEYFAHLHDAHDGRLDEQLPILLQVTLGRLLLLFQLRLHGNVDVDSKLFAVQSFKKKRLVSDVSSRRDRTRTQLLIASRHCYKTKYKGNICRLRRNRLASSSSSFPRKWFNLKVLGEHTAVELEWAANLARFHELHLIKRR